MAQMPEVVVLASYELRFKNAVELFSKKASLSIISGVILGRLSFSFK